MPIQIAQVDAFTSRPFSGNPAAVCLLTEDDPPQDWWLQDVAREMNLSETAFLVPNGTGFDLRWFTPTREVALCGHATLASAHVLWEEGRMPADGEILFHTRSGVLTVRRIDGDWIEMDFPAYGSTSIPMPDGLDRALSATVLSTRETNNRLLVELADEKTIRTLRPDMARLAQFEVDGVIVTSRAISERFDFVSRYFAPRVGIAEDPVTGSAHCSLATFWGSRLQKDELIGYQVSNRGGTVRMRREGDRVLLAGQAVTVLRGTLLA